MMDDDNRVGAERALMCFVAHGRTFMHLSNVRMV